MTIPNEINLTTVEFKGKLKAYEIKVTELKRKTFTEGQIDKIVLPITKGEHKEFEVKITALKAEQLSLLAYAGDFPEFNTELLKDTRLYPAEIKGITK